MKQRLEALLTPIWTPEMGQRLALSRMKGLRRQQELAEALGVSQKAVSRIESGRVKVLENPFSYERLRAVLGHHTNFVMTGADRARFDSALIRTRYWAVVNARDKATREQFPSLRTVKGRRAQEKSQSDKKDYVNRLNLINRYQGKKEDQTD